MSTAAEIHNETSELSVSSNGTATFDLVPRDLAEAMKLSELISKSKFIPQAYQGQPGDILIAVQYGRELGLKPLQALQGIACINGRPAIYGDAMLAVVQSSPLCEWVNEGDSTSEQGVCVVKRRGHEPYRSVFTVAQAKTAQLWGKSGPWTQYPERMLKLRARGFALRDKFADVLKGMACVEEAIDITPQGPAPLIAAPEQAQTKAEKVLERLGASPDTKLEQDLTASIAQAQQKKETARAQPTDPPKEPAPEPKAPPKKASTPADDAYAFYMKKLDVLEAGEVKEAEVLINEAASDCRWDGPSWKSFEAYYLDRFPSLRKAK